MAAVTAINEASRLYTVRELAELWSVSPRYLYRLIAAREIATVQLGRGVGDRNKLRIAHGEAMRWIADNTSTTNGLSLSARPP